MARECVRQCPQVQRLSAEAAESLRDQRRFTTDLRTIVRQGFDNYHKVRFPPGAAERLLGTFARRVNLAKRGADLVDDARAERSYRQCMRLLERSYGCPGPASSCPLEPGQEDPTEPVNPTSGEANPSAEGM